MEIRKKIPGRTTSAGYCHISRCLLQIMQEQIERKNQKQEEEHEQYQLDFVTCHTHAASYGFI